MGKTIELPGYQIVTVVNEMANKRVINKYQVKISQSSFKGETKILAKEAIFDKTDLIVACGGDGTINEILNEIKRRGFKIAIIPIGSGNGIARHFNIPLDISRSLDLILKQNYT